MMEIIAGKVTIIGEKSTSLWVSMHRRVERYQYMLLLEKIFDCYYIQK